MKECGVLEYNMLFSTMKEYKEKKKIIIKGYNKMSANEKGIYKWYVFSRPIIKEKQKEYIWNELNYWREYE